MSILTDAILQLRDTLYFDTDLFFQDLNSVKGKDLTELEKNYICKLMLGFSPTLIAKELNNQSLDEKTFENKVRNIRTHMSRTINQYIVEFFYQFYPQETVSEELDTILNGNRKDWPRLRQYLTENGYKLSGNIIITLEVSKIPPVELPEILSQILDNLHKFWDKSQIIQWLTKQIEKYQGQ